MALAVGCNSDPSEKSIDLNRSTAFVRSGLATPGSLDLESGWLRLGGSDSGARRIRIHELPIPGKPARQALQWFDRDMSFYSIAIPFQIESDQDFRSPAIRFAEIGERWAVYLNGHLTYSNLATNEVHPESKTRRDVIIPLDVRNLQSGTNTLLIQIQGDPVNMETGLYYDGPYRIDEYENLVNRAEAVDLALIAIYLSIGLFHILFFLQKKQE
ncbi:MAG: hypothetical protein KDK33_17115, partial [Leptospiraceae bacterium]|nr:hypothetical protein [Leptospiraceae bacterium]